MPLDVRRLRDSDMASLESPEACWAAVLLWSASWHQVPAASLPDDDRVLANLAGYGRVVKEWQRVREGALRGWVKCDDGRLYHPVVAEKALEAWDSKLHHAHGKLRERLRKSYGRDAAQPTFEQWISAGKPNDWPQSSAGIPPEQDANSAGKEKSSAGIPPENALKGEGEGEGKGYVNPKPLASGVPDSTVGTPAGAVCARLKSEARMADMNPSHPKLIAMLNAGLTADEIVSAGIEAVSKGKGFLYALATAEGRRRDAAASAALPNSRASPRPSIHDQRAEANAALTGKNRNHERTSNPERDITGESQRIA